jgi:hypothetical protein
MTKAAMTPPQVTPLLDGEPILWSARPGLMRSLTLTDIAGWVFAIGGIALAAYLYIDHARMTAAYADTAFGDMAVMRNRNLGLMIAAFGSGLFALVSSVAMVWRVTGTRYTITASRVIIAARSLTGAFTVAAPLWAVGTTVLGKGLFGYQVVIPAGDIAGSVGLSGLTEGEAREVLAQYESHRQGLPQQPVDDEADA